MPESRRSYPGDLQYCTSSQGCWRTWPREIFAAGRGNVPHSRTLTSTSDNPFLSYNISQLPKRCKNLLLLLAKSSGAQFRWKNILPWMFLWMLLWPKLIETKLLNLFLKCWICTKEVSNRIFLPESGPRMNVERPSASLQVGRGENEEKGNLGVGKRSLASPLAHVRKLSESTHTNLLIRLVVLPHSEQRNLQRGITQLILRLFWHL